jgi:endonuclease/exonuclease/phosphatase family metal-dependent hydrolase
MNAAAQSALMDGASRRQLRLLSFNIQAGSSIDRYREYVTRGWQHVLPHAGKRRNLAALAKVAAGYDLVALQEADAGSLRSGFQNQVQFLAESAGFPYWSHQPNRRVAKLAEPSNGLLSRLEPFELLDHKLPGRIPGRGALEVRLGKGRHALHVFIAHLALGARARRIQLDYLAEVMADHPYVVLMGDLNCTIDSRELKALFAKSPLRPPREALHTFPSWDPSRAIDHILVSESLEPVHFEVLPLRVSDHQPVAMTLELPRDVRL